MMFWKKRGSVNESIAAAGVGSHRVSQETYEIRAEASVDPRGYDGGSAGEEGAGGPIPSVCTRFTSELNPCQPWYSVMDRATGRKIDIPESFAPATCRAFLCKVSLGGFTIFTLIYAWVTSPYPYFFLAHLTSWCLLISAIYFLLSITNTLLAAWTPQPPDLLPCCSRIRMTWMVYEAAIVSEILISILYWVLEFDPSTTTPTFTSISSHGVVALTVFIDGNYINRIPLRIMHWYGVVLPWTLLMVLWLFIYSYSGIDNPNSKDYDNDPNTDDNLLYSVIDWKDEPVTAVIVCLVVVFGFSPILYLMLWCISLYTIPCCCRSDRRIYTDTIDENDRTRPTVSDVEEGSLFATWK